MGVSAAGSPPSLPKPRGPLSRAVIDLVRERSPLSGVPVPTDLGAATGWDEDLHLTLYLCYELHYRGFANVAAAWEWDPGLLTVRHRLEDRFLSAVRAELGPVPPLAEQLDALLVEPADGDGVSHFLLKEGRYWQAREYLVHRSLYHLKEADPQAWVIPRLHGAAQAALVAIEHDEYGAGRPERVHSALYAAMMVDFGLESGYGHYLDAVPAPALAVVNLMSLFALHRAHRGALVGQFAGVEITSSPGSARLVEAFERLGAGPDGTAFYRERVEADAVHEQLVRHGVIEALVRDEPALEADIAFGLAASSLLEERLARHLVSSWQAQHSSLLSPLPDAPGRAA
ncbi:iron-containing redox enzyme family protein [Kitasatospora sp. NPDC096147]|uniref:iron-containing redox enzyme family protein n=1 Tax=Kitasatospora sp. NPDC096147 TaxID=3364093 RepID=UPI00381C930C